MRDRDKAIINKIIEETAIGIKIIDGVKIDDFLQNEILNRAATMTALNIGEMVKSLSFEEKEKHKEIPWRSIAGLRDLAAHKYQTLNMEDVYQTIKIDFPDLRDNLKRILDES